MSSYILRDIDRELWQRAKAKAKQRIPNQSLKVVIESLIAGWLHGNVTLVAQPQRDRSLAMEWGFKAAERGWNLDKATEEFRKLNS